MRRSSSSPSSRRWQGQKLVWKYANSDLYTYPESQLAPEIAAAKARGIQFHNFTIQWHRDHP